MDLTKMISSAAIVLLAGLTLSLAPPAGETESASPVVSYAFRSPVVNGMGVSSLADLHGKPVLVEFWGTR